MSLGRSVALVLLGAILGVGLTIGAYYGVREYAPLVASRYLAGILAGLASPAGPAGDASPTIDATTVRGIVQEILCSEQGKAMISDLVQSQPRETFEALFRQVMGSPEFRKALSDALGTFLETPEGKTLLRRIASEVVGP